MKYFIIIIFVFGIVAKQFSQTVSPAVINSAGGGGTVGSSGVEVYYNIGEPIVSYQLYPME